MLKTCRADETLMNNPFSAKYRPGQILYACHDMVEVSCSNCIQGISHLPPSEAEDELGGVGRGAEVEFPIAYEAFRSEHVRIMRIRTVSERTSGSLNKT